MLRTARSLTAPPHATRPAPERQGPVKAEDVRRALTTPIGAPAYPPAGRTASPTAST
jgi:hypothetical protein